MLSFLWTVFIGFIAGVIAKFVTPGSGYEPKGFILTTVLGVTGALLATYLGQAIGWYRAGQEAGFIGTIVVRCSSCWCGGSSSVVAVRNSLGCPASYGFCRK